MDTITKVIIGSLIAVFAVIAAIIYIVTREVAITLVFTGLATSGMTALAGISYGARLAATPEYVIDSAVKLTEPTIPQIPPTTPPVQ